MGKKTPSVCNDEYAYKGLHSYNETLWVEIQPFLLKHGYKLRPRHNPKWKASWRRPWNFFYKDMMKCPDYIGMPFKHHLMDAIRISDGVKVVIKRAILDYDNVPCLEYLNSPQMREDPRNITVPLLEVIPLPNSYALAEFKDSVLLVMPMLFPFAVPWLPFQHLKEIVEGFDQLIDGLVFLHEHRIAHRDFCRGNFMMDPINVIPNGFHFTHKFLQPDGKTRLEYKDRCSVSPVKYYVIDYETANDFSPNYGCVGMFGQVKFVPEMSDTVPFDPFKLDVYQLGTLLRELIGEYDGLECLSPLAIAMTIYNPESRPTALESFQQFQDLVSTLKPIDLSQEIWLKSRTPEQRGKVVNLPLKEG